MGIMEVIALVTAVKETYDQIPDEWKDQAGDLLEEQVQKIRRGEPLDLSRFKELATEAELEERVARLREQLKLN